ncbi:hypothetical protein MN0502_30470 [Arthrobacter sp. MN05-02]|nr:hypothetical protein MN0502_30470 [Arthrobacter sp. MN05-02]
MALIAAFARPAQLYLLDEPSSGLDPLTELVFRRQVRRASADGATVLLSSHILSEVEQLCGRVTIIRSGRAVETGALAALRHLRLTHFRVEGVGAAGLADLPGLCNIRTDGDVVEFDVNPADLPLVLEVAAAAGISGLSVSPPSLESLFLSHYDDPTDQVR